MRDLRVFYDEEEDILYIAKEGEEVEVLEIVPGINLEIDKKGNLIGIEIFNASTLFKNILKPIEKNFNVSN